MRICALGASIKKRYCTHREFNSVAEGSGAPSFLCARTPQQTQQKQHGACAILTVLQRVSAREHAPRVRLGARLHRPIPDATDLAFRTSHRLTRKNRWLPPSWRKSSPTCPTPARASTCSVSRTSSRRSTTRSWCVSLPRGVHRHDPAPFRHPNPRRRFPVKLSRTAL